jgi:uncharacterized protein YkwD
MRRATAFAASAAILVAVLVPAARSPAASECANADVTPTADNHATAAKALKCLIQAARTDRGLAKLTPSKALGTAAAGYAQRMADERFFSHTSPDGKTVCKRVRAAGYPKTGQVAEALGWGLGGSATPRELLKVITSDAIHRSILFTKTLKDIGVGVAAEPPIKGERAAGATAVVDIARKSAGATAGGATRCG